MTSAIKFKLSITGLLMVVFLLPYLSAQNFSPASDETTHIPSGYSYIKTGDLKLNPQHPPLVKILAALPLTLLNINFDATDPTFSSPLFDEWQFGRKFFGSNNIDQVLLYSRFSIQLISVLLAFYIYLWASEMFSKKAGILGLFIYAFMPNIIAHSQFVTMDIAVTAFPFIAMYYLWKFFKTNSHKHLIFSAVSMGLGLSSKFSAVVFLPIIAIFLLVYIWHKNYDSDLKIRNFLKYSIFFALSSFAVVYLLYFLPKDLGFYIRGMRLIYADWSSSHYFFLNGQFSTTGWWYYFIYAFLVKTPIPFLLALFSAVVLLVLKKSDINLKDKSFLLIPPVFFFIVTTFRAGDIGVRYILPIYPFLILFTSVLATIDWSKLLGWKNIYILYVIIGLLGFWYIFSAAVTYPDYLAYFNEFIGGTDNGYKHLDDSNIEWGQDLKRLKVYQDEHPDLKVMVSWAYADLSSYGIKNKIDITKDALDHPKGLYAVNVHFLIHSSQKSKEYNDPLLDWLNLYKPAARIGQSFFIYDF